MMAFKQIKPTLYCLAGKKNNANISDRRLMNKTNLKELIHY